MAIKNAKRLLILWLLGAVAAQAIKGQQTPLSMDGARHNSASTPSRALPEMAPPKPPKITCAGDQLTISADNSTLSAILTAVHVCTGVQVDVPEGASASRVFEELGPGPARQVLESLLGGSDFNFVIGSSDKDPQKIESVLLMLRPTETASARDGAPDHPATAARRAWQQTRQNRPASLAGDESRQASDEAPSTQDAEDSADAGTEKAAASAAQAAGNDSQPPASETPSSSGERPAPPTQNPFSPSASSPSGDSSQATGQKIADMQQMFQQRRQMIQSQNQGQSPTSPQP
jgi:hypothetical protein